MKIDSLTSKSFEVVCLVIIVGLIPVLWTDSTIDPNEHLQFLCLALSVFFVWIRLYIKKENYNLGEYKISFWYYLFFLLFLASGLIALIIAPNFADASFMYAKYVLFFFLTISVVKLQEELNYFTIIVRVLVITSIIVVIPAVNQLMQLVQENELLIPKSTYLIPSVFAHRNLFVEYLILALPFVIYAVLSDAKTWRILGLFSLNVNVFFIVLLSNRTVWIALVLIVLLTFMYLLISRKILELKSVVLGLNIVIIAAVSVMTLLHFSDQKSLQNHTLNSMDLKQGSTKDRFQLWTRTVKLIEENPVLGKGLDSWKIDVIKFGNKGLQSEDNVSFYQRPHNDFLWVFVEQGLVGVVLYFLMFAIPLVSILLMLFKKDDSIPKMELFVVFLVLIVYLLIAQLSFPKERISHNVLFYVSIGLWLSFLKKKYIFNLKGNYQFLIIFTMLSALIYIGFSRFNSDIHAKKAILYKSSGMFVDCIEEVDRAKTLFYNMDETSTPLDWYRGISNFNLGNYTETKTDFESSIILNPYHIYTLSDYASCLSKVGDNERAIINYKKAIELSPNYLDAQLNLCALYFQKNKLDEAFELLKTIDLNVESSRLQKTIRVVIKSLINRSIKDKSASLTFIETSLSRINDQQYFMELLRKSIIEKKSFAELSKN